VAGSRVVELRFLSDVGGLQKGFRQAGKDGETFGRRLSGKVGGGLKALGIGALGAGAALAGGLVVGLKASVEAALESEESQARVDAALKKVGATSEAFKGKVDSVISSLSDMGALDDEDLANAFADMTRTTGNAQASLKNMSVVADLARAKNISLAAAAKIVGKVQNGNVGVLKKYGIELKKGATAQQGLAALQHKFGGAAKAYGETTKGSIERASIAFGNLKESIGTQLLPVIAQGAQKLSQLLNQYGPVIAQKLGVAVAWVKTNWPEIKATIERVMQALRPIIEPILQNVAQVFHLIGALIHGDWSGVWSRLKAIVTNDLHAIGAYIRALAPLIGQAAQRLGRFLLDQAKAEIRKLPGQARAALQALWSAVKQYAPQVGAAALDLGKQLWSKAKQEGSKLASKVGEEVGKLPGKIKSFGEDVGAEALSLGSTIFNKVLEGLAGLPGKILELVKSAIRGGAALFNDAQVPQFSGTLSTPSFTIPNPLPIGGDFHVPSYSHTFSIGPYDLPDIPLPFRDGGIVRARPGGTLGRLAEAGDDEAVIPLNRRGLRRAGLGGDTVVIHQHIAGSVVTERQLFDGFIRYVERSSRRDRAVLPVGSVRLR